MARPKHTPWGKPQTTTETAEGITFFRTPGHGGYHLDPKRQRIVQRLFPDHRPFAGGPWYEEDQDWAVVALAFPESFDVTGLRAAIRTARLAARPWRDEVSPSWVAVVEWIDGTNAGQCLSARVHRWELEHADKWERGSFSGPARGYPPHCWTVSFRRIGDGMQDTFVLAGYPKQCFYTLSELQNLEAEPLPEPEPLVSALEACDGEIYLA